MLWDERMKRDPHFSQHISQLDVIDTIKALLLEVKYIQTSFWYLFFHYPVGISNNVSCSFNFSKAGLNFRYLFFHVELMEC